MAVGLSGCPSGGGKLTAAISALAVVRAGILLVGALLALLAFARFARGGGRDHLLLSVGFALIALGTLVEGMLFVFLGWSLVAGHTVEAGFTALGMFAVLLAILLSRR